MNVKSQKLYQICSLLCSFGSNLSRALNLHHPYISLLHTYLEGLNALLFELGDLLLIGLGQTFLLLDSSDDNCLIDPTVTLRCHIVSQLLASAIDQ